MDCPIWLDELMRGMRCNRFACRRLLSPRSVRSIGAAVVDRGMDLPFEQTAQIQVACEHCGSQFTLRLEIDFDELIEGVRWVYHHGSEAATPGHGQIEAEAGRGVQALGPLEEAEVRPFLERLRRTSFRRSSKSCQQWIERLSEGF